MHPEDEKPRPPARHCPLEGRQGGMSALLLFAAAVVLAALAASRLSTPPAFVDWSIPLPDGGRGATDVAAAPKPQKFPADDPENWIQGAPSPDFAALHDAAPPEAAPPADSWPLYRGSLWQTGLSRSTLPSELKRRWTYQHDDEVVSAAAIADGTVYVSTLDGTLLALRLSDGEPLWRFDLEAECKSAPLVAGDFIVIADERGRLHAIERDSGRRRWQIDRKFTLTTPQVISRTILSGGYDETLQALDLSDGRQRWSWPNTEPVVSPATLLGDAVAFGGCDGKVHIIDLADGRELATVAAKSPIGAAMPWDGQGLYVVTVDGVVSRLHRRPGTVVAQAPVAWPPAPLAEVASAEAVPAAVAPTAVSEQQASGEPAEVGPGDWLTQWEVDYSRPGAISVAEHAPQAPALVGDRLVTTFSDGSVRCLRSDDGRPYWVRKPGGPLLSSPVIADGRIIIGDELGTLFVLSLADGRTLWQDVIGGRLTAAPVIAAGCVVVGSTSGAIVCYGE